MMDYFKGSLLLLGAISYKVSTTFVYMLVIPTSFFLCEVMFLVIIKFSSILDK